MEELNLPWEPLLTLIQTFIINNFPMIRRELIPQKQLHQKYMILKSAKGNGVELMNKSDYQDAMKQLFSDETKVKIIKNYWKLLKSSKTIKIIKNLN